MNEIVRKIIEIDNEANQIVQEANLKADDIVKEISDEEQQLKNTFTSKADKNINKLKEHYNTLIEQESHDIENQTQGDLKKIDKAFDDSSEQWIDTIFNKITRI
ncbi:MAG: hypothetical protein GX346_03850 [Clostridiales bacterium]|nr:hypothetical protein [Clostridiales bacterium]